jgi:predicted SprT family Zn-dependent metalloprotease
MSDKIDLTAAFGHYNVRFWDGDLPEVPCSYADLRGTGAVGEFWPDSRRIVVCSSLDEEQVLGTLVHEMIHLYQSTRGLAVNHGREFKAWKSRVESSTGLAI